MKWLFGSHDDDDEENKNKNDKVDESAEGDPYKLESEPEIDGTLDAGEPGYAEAQETERRPPEKNDEDTKSGGLWGWLRHN